MVLSVSKYQAVFDALAIVGTLQVPFSGVSEAELHLVSYVGCLLSLYEGHPADDWGYRFVSSTVGAPFSQTLHEATEMLLNAGHLRRADGGRVLHTTGSGDDLRHVLASLREHAERQPFLDAARRSVIMMPIGEVRSALADEPSLKSARLHRSVQPLGVDAPLQALYGQFALLRRAVPEGAQDLSVAALVWFAYLEWVRQRSSTDALAGGWKLRGSDVG